MPHDERTAIRRVNDALRDMPLLDRVAALCASLIHEEPRAPEMICVLVEVAKIMAKNLPDEAGRTAVVWHLNEVAVELRAKWN